MTNKNLQSDVVFFQGGAWLQLIVLPSDVELVEKGLVECCDVFLSSVRIFPGSVGVEVGGEEEGEREQRKRKAEHWDYPEG